MYPIIAKYVQSCGHCIRTKSRNATPGTLQQFETVPGRWTHIAVDLVNGFPKITHQNNVYDAALVIVDIFSGRVHFHPINYQFFAKDFIDYLIYHHFPNHGVPQAIISDRGPQFTAKHYQDFLAALHCESHLAVTAHHASNGKVERHIRTLQDYLVSTVDQNEDCYNPSSPSLSSLLPSDNVQAADITEKLNRYANTAQAALRKAFLKNKAYFDASKLAVEFDVGDKVFILQSALVKPGDSHNAQLVPSFRTKFVGPFTITDKLSPVNYKLDLPVNSRRDSPFHISQLKLYSPPLDATYVAPKSDQARLMIHAPLTADKSNIIPSEEEVERVDYLSILLYSSLKTSLIGSRYTHFLFGKFFNFFFAFWLT
ncbi:hypothetical protein CANINC_000092 [Pichia inconspicua]|uniref:Integrase catalytic domain-containing protein n=1 Tax=Pichia inconspicua TaxID=52247 RepID=A0A4T0X9F7_9ASCO|nr:hypothetical protein CANINC_000092 [[Candida] inconspicua]